MDRRVEILQYKIQQQLTLQSDEVERLSNLMISLKAGISTARDRLQSLERDIKNKRELRKGALKRLRSSHEAAISKYIISHHQTLKELTESQEKEIEEIQRDFSQALAELTDDKRYIENEQFYTIQKSIDEAKTKLGTIMTMTDTVTNTPPDPADTTMIEIQNQRIDELRKMILSKNKERGEMLKQSKRQLVICVEALEELEHNHEMNISHYHNNLNKIDAKYKSDTSKLKEQHISRMDILKQRLNEARTRAKATQRSYERLENKNREALTMNLRQIELVKATTIPPPKLQNNKEDEEKLRELRIRYKELRKGFEQKEENLHSMREANESMKREIARLQFQQRYGNRSTV
ncbi:hypothetical protein TRFO_17523 [Tritrichomonas foetus]|uniref:Uncharacterized protein n=1 Tax=Tritrichomonas foetus TaxID=1144522 RepID=A0A1J4KT63_9EUKA|nr:hypothetical protein TRFO_17523 [Tritrichomonas foetus]|eukprot:OHT12677.1 hypothetical protein TRFO_17523 [Tritrichomonas foetus]